MMNKALICAAVAIACRIAAVGFVWVSLRSSTIFSVMENRSRGVGIGL